MKSQSLSKGVLVVLIANVISMLFNVLINFLQPKYLSVETFSVIKTFTLYLTLTGLFHLGYMDGMYIKYGGREVSELNRDELSTNISTMRILQVVISFLFLLVGLLLGDDVLVLFSILLIPFNMTMYFKLLYQATGEFSLYGRIMNVSTAALFLGNLLLIFVFHRQGYFWYIAIQILIYVVIWFFLEFDFNHKIHTKFQILKGSISEAVEMVKSGFFVMLGNFSSIFLTVMDRWLVKWLMTALDFAGYSFATSVEGFLNVAVTPFTITFYNYFCRVSDVKSVQKVHNLMLIVSTVIIILAFAIKFVVEIYLPDYLFSMNVLFILFASQVFFIIIKSIYVNLYKAQRKQTIYFKKLAIVMVLGFFVTLLCYYIFLCIEAIAIGTLISSIFWFVLCQMDFKEVSYDGKHLIYMLISVTSFIFCGVAFNSIIGMLIYIGLIVILGLAFIRTDYIELLLFVKSKYYATLGVKSIESKA